VQIVWIPVTQGVYALKIAIHALTLYVLNVRHGRHVDSVLLTHRWIKGFVSVTTPILKKTMLVSLVILVVAFVQEAGTQTAVAVLTQTTFKRMKQFALIDVQLASLQTRVPILAMVIRTMFCVLPSTTTMSITGLTQCLV
jgi:hypothetical protein